MSEQRDDAFAAEDVELVNKWRSRSRLQWKQYGLPGISRISRKSSVRKNDIEEEIKTAYDFEDIAGSSAALKRVLKQVEIVAPTDSTVLIFR